MMRNGNKVAFPDRPKKNGNYGPGAHDPESKAQEAAKDVGSMSRIELLKAGLAAHKVAEAENEMKTDTRGSFKDGKKKVMFQDTTEDLD